MTTRSIRTDADKGFLLRLVENRKPPFTVTITEGVKRSGEQNRLQRKWLLEAAEQLRDGTAEDYRAYCKLYFGVPILRAENDAFRQQYDRTVKPLDYELKLEVMKDPISLPVTSLMTKNQKTRYLDAMYQHFRGLGVQLTEPGE